MTSQWHAEMEMMWKRNKEAFWAQHWSRIFAIGANMLLESFTREITKTKKDERRVRPNFQPQDYWGHLTRTFQPVLRLACERQMPVKSTRPPLYFPTVSSPRLWCPRSLLFSRPWCQLMVFKLKRVFLPFVWGTLARRVLQAAHIPSNQTRPRSEHSAVTPVAVRVAANFVLTRSCLDRNKLKTEVKESCKYIQGPWYKLPFFFFFFFLLFCFYHNLLNLSFGTVPLRVQKSSPVKCGSVSCVVYVTSGSMM